MRLQTVAQKWLARPKKETKKEDTGVGKVK